MHGKRFVSHTMQSRIHASYQSLTARFFISRGSVYLSCKEQTFHHLRFKRMFQLRRVKEIIFYCIARTVNPCVSQCRNLPDGFNLNVHRHGRRESVQVHLVRIFAFGFQEKQVLVSVGKRHEFCLYRRTITRTYRLYLSVVKRRVSQTAPKRFVNFLIRVAFPTRQLFQATRLSHVTKLMVVVLALLNGHVLKVYASLVYAHGCSRLHPSHLNAILGNALGKMENGRFGNPSPNHLLPSDVHQTIEKCSCGYHDALSSQFSTPDSLHANRLAILYEQLVGLVLPDVQVVGIVECCSPLPDKLTPVALSAWRPNGRSF